MAAKGKGKEAYPEDEFLETLKTGYRYVQENIRFVSVIAGGILAGVLIILLVLYQVKRNRVQESLAMDRAVAAYHAGKTEKALPAFRKISEKKDLTSARAELYLGNLLYDQGNYKEAISHFEKARKLAGSRQNELIPGLAVQGIVYSEIASGNPDRAEQTLKSVNGLFEDLSLLLRGRICAERGETQKAVTFLNRLISNHSDSPWVASAQKLKDRLQS